MTFDCFYVSYIYHYVHRISDRWTGSGATLFECRKNYTGESECADDVGGSGWGGCSKISTKKHQTFSLRRHIRWSLLCLRWRSTIHRSVHPIVHRDNNIILYRMCAGLDTPAPRPSSGRHNNIIPMASRRRYFLFYSLLRETVHFFLQHHYFLLETIWNDITRCRFRVCDATRVQFATSSIVVCT